MNVTRSRCVPPIKAEGKPWASASTQAHGARGPIPEAYAVPSERVNNGCARSSFRMKAFAFKLNHLERCELPVFAQMSLSSQSDGSLLAQGLWDALRSIRLPMRSAARSIAPCAWGSCARARTDPQGSRTRLTAQVTWPALPFRSRCESTTRTLRITRACRASVANSRYSA
jgi:hypothetical protein